MISNNFNFFICNNISQKKIFFQILKKLLIILCLYINSTVYAEIHVDITTGRSSPKLIAIVPFNKNTKTTQNTDNISDIISSDLRHSGKFCSLPFLQFPEKINHISDISVEKWLQLGINILLIGNISEITNNEYKISYQLINISHHSKTVTLQNQYTISNRWIRHAAHSISNDIFEKITGIKGAFCTRIAYITYDTDNEKNPYKLYISDYDGYNEILIHHSKEPLMSPTWSPSGHHLSYVIFENYRSMLVIHDLKNGIIRQLISFPRHNGAPCFSPDGKKLAFVLSKTGSLNLYVMDLVSKEIQQITNERSNNTEPSWFPDNKTLVYTSDRSGTPQIYKINIEDINNFSPRLSWLNSNNQNGHISSDGKWLVMISKTNDGQNVTKLDLLTGKSNRLTDGILDETLTLAPNDNMIIYNTSEGLESKLYLLSMNGHCKVCLDNIPHKKIRFPAWSSYID